MLAEEELLTRGEGFYNPLSSCSVLRGRGLEDPLEMHRRPRLDILATKALVQQAFEGASFTPYKVKFPHDQRVCELRFDFPEVARVACEDELAWLPSPNPP